MGLVIIVTCCEHGGGTSICIVGVERIHSLAQSLCRFLVCAVLHTFSDVAFCHQVRMSVWGLSFSHQITTYYRLIRQVPYVLAIHCSSGIQTG
jgi:hypothetical protein